jgi:hypothetical protein
MVPWVRDGIPWLPGIGFTRVYIAVVKMKHHALHSGFAVQGVVYDRPLALPG